MAGAKHLREGWIRAYRSLFSETDAFWGDAERWRAWLDLVQLARWQTETGVVEVTVDGGATTLVTAQRGEVVSTHRALGRRWGWHHERVRRFLADLVCLGRAERLPARRGIVHLRLANYDAYNPALDGSCAGSVPVGAEKCASSVPVPQHRKSRRSRQMRPRHRPSCAGSVPVPPEKCAGSVPVPTSNPASGKHLRLPKKKEVQEERSTPLPPTCGQLVEISAHGVSRRGRVVAVEGNGSGQRLFVEWLDGRFPPRTPVEQLGAYHVIDQEADQ